MKTILSTINDVSLAILRPLRFDYFAEVRPAAWKRYWSWAAERGERGAWDVEIWAGRIYVVFGQTPRSIPTTGTDRG